MNVVILEHPRVRSEAHFNDIANTPLWSCLLAGYAAACIRQAGHEATIFDAPRLGWRFERTQNEILNAMPDLLCIHAVYFWEHTAALFDFITQLCRDGFNGHLNLFGFFPTLAYPVILNSNPNVDSIAVGECEWTLMKLAKCLAAGRDWRMVAGLAHRRSDGTSALAQRPPEPEPDRFPFPLRPVIDGETVSVLASRGCYNHCRFCPIPAFYNDGPLWRGRSPDNVAEEIATLMARGAEDFYFVDPNFIGPGARGKDRTRRLLALLEPMALNFGMETRANDLDDELLEHLLSAGLQSLLIGIESGSRRILENLDKHDQIFSSEAAIRACRKVGIEPEIGFLMFVPDATLEDLGENFAYLRRNHLLGRLDRTANLLCHRQIIFMGTSGYRRFREEGRITGAGPLGFQVDVSWRDDRARWMADVVGHACIHVLAETGRPSSPIFWRHHPDWQRCSAINDFLVDLFASLAAELKVVKSIPSAVETKSAVQKELRKIIKAIE
jgi:anaerobic magnesium-protoporphyrin IX monomethyl ester cyclase